MKSVSTNVSLTNQTTATDNWKKTIKKTKINVMETYTLMTFTTQRRKHICMNLAYTKKLVWSAYIQSKVRIV
jgi:hypothetical protein